MAKSALASRHSACPTLVSQVVWHFSEEAVTALLHATSQGPNDAMGIRRRRGASHDCPVCRGAETTEIGLGSENLPEPHGRRRRPNELPRLVPVASAAGGARPVGWTTTELPTVGPSASRRDGVGSASGPQSLTRRQDPQTSNIKTRSMMRGNGSCLCCENKHRRRTPTHTHRHLGRKVVEDTSTAAAHEKAEGCLAQAGPPGGTARPSPRAAPGCPGGGGLPPGRAVAG